MIWLKRLLPLLVVAFGYFAWSAYTKSREADAAAQDAHRALVTAQVWQASALERVNPARYLAFRDSVLQANNITTEEMFRYLKVFESDPARQLRFSQLVSRYVDSLSRRADSLRRVNSTDTVAPSSGTLLPPQTLP